MTLLESFESKFEIVEPGGCWVWTESRHPRGYGQIYLDPNHHAGKAMRWHCRTETIEGEPE